MRTTSDDSVGKASDPRFRVRKRYTISGNGEADAPKSDNLNIYDPEFGWVLKGGKPTQTAKAYWEKKRRETKE
jgi:hypothetical protein